MRHTSILTLTLLASVTFPTLAHAEESADEQDCPCEKIDWKCMQEHVDQCMEPADQEAEAQARAEAEALHEAEQEQRDAAEKNRRAEWRLYGRPKTGEWFARERRLKVGLGIWAGLLGGSVIGGTAAAISIQANDTGYAAGVVFNILAVPGLVGTIVCGVKLKRHRRVRRSDRHAWSR